MSRADLFNSRNFNPVNHIVRSVLIYLRECFKNNPDLEFPVCSEDMIAGAEALKGLLILDQNTWDTSFRGHLPSIVLQRGNITFGGGIQSGDMSRVLNAAMDLQTSTVEIVSVPVVLSCIGRQDLEADTLAFITSCFLHDDKRWAKSFGLYGIQSPQISPVQAFNPQTPGFVSSVSTSISTTRKYNARLLPEQKLTEISIFLNENPIGRVIE